MNKIFIIVFLFWLPALLYAQTEIVCYRVSDTTATYAPAGKKYFKPGDTITVKRISNFELERRIKGKYLQSSSVNIVGLQGKYEISALYKEAGKRKKYGTSTPGGQNTLSGDKSGNSDAVIPSLLYYFSHPDLMQMDSNVLQVIRKESELHITNKGDSLLYIDVIWVKNDQCVSAVSYAEDFCSYPLAAGETDVIFVDKYASAETLFVVGTSVPVAYNTINLRKCDKNVKSDVFIVINRVE